MFEVRMRKEYQCFFQRNLDFRKYSEFLRLCQDIDCYEMENNFLVMEIIMEYFFMIVINIL